MRDTPISQLQSSILMASLSLIPNNVLRYTHSSRLSFALPSLALSTFNARRLGFITSGPRSNARKTFSSKLDPTVPGVSKLALRNNSVKRTASVLRCGLFETTTFTVNKYRLFSGEITACEMKVKSICAAVEFMVEEENLRKYTEDITETESMLASFQTPVVNEHHTRLKKLLHPFRRYPSTTGQWTRHYVQVYLPHPHPHTYPTPLVVVITVPTPPLARAAPGGVPPTKGAQSPPREEKLPARLSTIAKHRPPPTTLHPPACTTHTTARARRHRQASPPRGRRGCRTPARPPPTPPYLPRTHARTQLAHYLAPLPLELLCICRPRKREPHAHQRNTRNAHERNSYSPHEHSPAAEINKSNRKKASRPVASLSRATEKIGRNFPRNTSIVFGKNMIDVRRKRRKLITVLGEEGSGFREEGRGRQGVGRKGTAATGERRVERRVEDAKDGDEKAREEVRERQEGGRANNEKGEGRRTGHTSGSRGENEVGQGQRRGRGSEASKARECGDVKEEEKGRQESDDTRGMGRESVSGMRGEEAWDWQKTKEQEGMCMARERSGSGERGRRAKVEVEGSSKGG
ncbi:hypothetical protein B0H11DRAFT_2195434 [Mycena galericulata]|nr:hypothetical protein B0H11DRAFT_2195434 [Mycena galericulata]